MREKERVDERDGLNTGGGESVIVVEEKQRKLRILQLLKFWWEGMPGG